jgi:hypothetical protein
MGVETKAAQKDKGNVGRTTHDSSDRMESQVGGKRVWDVQYQSIITLCTVRNCLPSPLDKRRRL